MFAFLEADKSLRNKTQPLFTVGSYVLLNRGFVRGFFFCLFCHNLFTYMSFQTHLLLFCVFMHLADHCIAFPGNRTVPKLPEYFPYNAKGEILNLYSTLLLTTVHSHICQALLELLNGDSKCFLLFLFGKAYVLRMK